MWSKINFQSRDQVHKKYEQNLKYLIDSNKIGKFNLFYTFWTVTDFI